MIYSCFYQTPDQFDDIMMYSDGSFLTGLFFTDKKSCEDDRLEVFDKTVRWLDIYFSGKEPDFMPEYKVEGLSPFGKRVNELIACIPYGQTVTYGDLAGKIAEERGIKKMSAQAVGQAAGANPICIIVPCHRVIGTGGNLVGYGGGLKNKVALLKLEHHEMSKFFLPE